MKELNFEVCILGAGPAGLASALELTKKGITDIAIIDRNKLAGGLSRTEARGNYRFDVGPHRFFTKSHEVNKLWHETLGSDFIPVNRLTRIYYNNKYFNYPIKAGDVLTKMPPHELIHAMFSFGLTKFKSQGNELTFEDWVSNKFGRKLFNTFFKTYTEKVWGIPCNEIGAEWAAQRIKGLNFVEVIKNSFGGSGKNKPKTLVDQFDYPVLGAGQMYEAWLEQAVNKGAKSFLSTAVTKIVTEENQVKALICKDGNGEELKVTANQFFCSIPLTHFFYLQEDVDANIKKAVDALYYREHITVDFLLDGQNYFPDQWIYIHSPEVKMARIANYNNFSKAMVNNENKTGMSVEYFVFQTDELWKMNDSDIIALAKEELVRTKLIDGSKVLDAWVVRETESYPTYYLGFKDSYELLKNELDKYSNITPVGRGGMYKYNNQDHSIVSGLLAARNYLNPNEKVDLWEINIDAEYHESAQRS